jgi:hypothetical protein
MIIIRKIPSFNRPRHSEMKSIFVVVGLLIIFFSPFNIYRIPLSSIVTLSFTKILFFLALFLLLSLFATSRHSFNRFVRVLYFFWPTIFAYLILILSFGMMLLRSNSIAYSIKIIVLSVVVVSMSFLIAYLGRRPGRLILMLKALLVGSLVVSGFGLFQIVHFYLFGDIPPAPFLDYFLLPHEDSKLHREFMWYIPGFVPRIISVLSEPNALGLYLALVLFINAWVIKYRSYLNLGSGLFRLSILSSIFTIIPFIMTFSRSGWLTLIVGLGVLALGFSAKARVKSFFLVLAFLVVSLVLITYFMPNIGEALLERFSIDETYGHIDIRLHALSFFVDMPLLGVGFGNYGLLAGNSFGVSSTHSFYVTYLVEGGLIGGLAFLFFIFSLAFIFILKNGGKLSRDPYWLLGFGIAIMIIINNIFYHTFWLEITWVALGIAFAALYIFSSQRNQI